MVTEPHRARTGPLTAAIFGGLLALAMVSPGCGGGDETDAKDNKNKPTGYVGALLRSKDRAQAVASQVQMKSLYTALTDYATRRGGAFPAALKVLADEGAVSGKALERPGGGAYGYVPGQRQDMPNLNVLLYDPLPGPDGRLNVLRLDGRVETLTQADLEAALAATNKRIAER